MLEALLKRVDGLERRLKDEKKGSSDSPESNEGPGGAEESQSGDLQQQPQIESDTGGNVAEEAAIYSPPPR